MDSHSLGDQLVLVTRPAERDVALRGVFEVVVCLSNYVYVTGLTAG